MNKILLIFVITLFTFSCGGGGDPIDPSTVPAGIYTGTVTPAGGTPDSAVALITSDNEAALVDIDTVEAFIGTVSGKALTGTMYASSAIAATAVVTSISGNNISGTYNSALGGGAFALVADPDLYNRSSSLTKLVGTWVDTSFTNITGITTWLIQSDGSFTVSSTASCTASGSFSVFNSTKNEYKLTLSLINCSSFDGNYTGFAAISDTFNTDDTLSLIFSNGTNGGISMPIKQ